MLGNGGAFIATTVLDQCMLIPVGVAAYIVRCDVIARLS